MLGLTRQGLANYESGERTPATEIADRIAEKLAMPRRFFFSEPLDLGNEPVFYRSLAAATKTARRKAEQRLSWLEEALVPIEKQVELPMVNLPKLRLPLDPSELSDEDIEDAAAAVREHWELPDGPIGNLVEVAERHGFVVTRFHMDAPTLDAFSRWSPTVGRPLVALNSGKGSASRQRLDTAHEIGHQILHRHVDASALRKPAILKSIEAQAFLFGAALLMPVDSFLNDVDSTSLESLKALKASWKVSIGAMLMRLVNLNIVSEKDSKYLWRSYAMQGFRRAEPLDDVIEHEVPTLAARAVNTLGGAQALSNILSSISLSDALTEELLGLRAGPITPSVAAVFHIPDSRERDRAAEPARDAEVLPFRRPLKQN